MLKLTARSCDRISVLSEVVDDDWHVSCHSLTGRTGPPHVDLMDAIVVSGRKSIGEDARTSFVGGTKPPSDGVYGHPAAVPVNPGSPH